MDGLHDKRFPGESADYRKARDALLEAEAALRRQIEALAEARRRLPPGGKVAEDYLFEEGEGRQVRLSELFSGGKASLLLYSFMYGPDDARPCASCTSFLDGLDGQVHHAVQRVNIAVIAKSPIARIRAFAATRGWRRLRLLSSAGNSFNRDYFGETTEGAQMPMLNVFESRADGIYHRWGSELLYAPWEEGMEPRHLDLVWPLWNLLDLTPEGRGEDTHPRLTYDEGA